MNRKVTQSEFLGMEAAAESNVAKCIRETFSRKECTVFVPKIEQTPTRGVASPVQYCNCGASVEEHVNQEKLPIGSTQWTEDKCITKMPTNTFGRMRYSASDIASSQTTSYLRLANDTEQELTLDFMKQYWRLFEDDDKSEKPQLIISVVGGGRMFKLAENVQKKLFSRELMRAVATTNGWLLTSGLDAGVARAVGHALRESQSFVWRDELGKFKRKIYCIGIAPWGGVFGASRLVNPSSERINDINYPVFAAGSQQFRFKKRLPLNAYHTHFLLVDDGYRNRERGVAEFRAKLERQISLSTDNGGLGVPVVQILIDGAANALEIVAKSVTEGVPVLICEGTGRAADLVAQVCRLYGRLCKTTDEAEKASKLAAFQYTLRERVITNLYGDHLPIDAEDRYDRCVRDILQICEKRQMVTIFNVKRGSALDTAILASLMDRTQHTERSSQLSLALKWNRIDVAKAKIFGPAASSETSFDLWPFFMEALITNKPEFVRLFIEYGLDVKASLTVRDLTYLYQHSTAEPQTLLWRLMKVDSSKLKPRPLSLCDISKMIKAFARRFDHPLYSCEQQDDESMSKTFDEPFDELFLWSVLLNNDVMTVRFWEYSEEPLVTGIAGTLLCQSLAQGAKGLTGTLRAQQLALKGKLESLAISLAVKAYAADVEQTMLLLHRRWKKWGNFSCLELAAMAKDQVFLSSEPCQYAIWKTWTRGYDASGWAIALSAFTVFPVLFAIRFEDEDGHKPSPADLRGSIVSIAKTAPVSTPMRTNVTLVPEIVDGALLSKSEEHHRNHDNHGGKRFLFRGSNESLAFMSPFHAGLSAWRKYVTFYRSPSAKFACYTLSYLIYLLLYAYVILFAFRVRPTTSEIVLHLWTFTLFTEQLRLILTHPSDSVKEKFDEWWIYSAIAAWNRLDFLMLFMYLLAFVLRWFSFTFHAARLILASNYITCLFRLFKIYFVNSYLGPKVVMLKAFDLAMFLLVLIIILLSYTVVSHALLFPYRDFYTGIFWDLLYHGVWVLFGEVQPELERTTIPVCQESADNMTMVEFVASKLDCATASFPPPILLAAYCFFGNILLVNMLIATFTNVFEEVQRNSEHLWKYMMYFVVKEYNEKPTLPPPFIILEHVHLLFTQCRRCKIFGQKLSADLVWGRALTSKNYRFLSVFEKTIRSDLVEETQQDDGKQVEKLLPEVNEKVNRIFAILRSMKADAAAAQHGGGRKRKGKGQRRPFVPAAVSEFAAKFGRRQPVAPSAISGKGGQAIVPDSIPETGDDSGFPMIDDEDEMTQSGHYDDFDFDFDDNFGEDGEDGADLLEHIA